MNIYKYILLLIISTMPAANALAQTGPGGIGTNDGTSALKMWFDANYNVYTDLSGTSPAFNGNRIRYWVDRSGNNASASINIDKQRPTFIDAATIFNGHAALRFNNGNGINDEFNALFTNSYTPSGHMTIYCIFHPLSAGGGDDNSFTGGASSSQWYNGAGLVDGDVMGIQNDIGLSFTNLSIAAGTGDGATIDYTIKTLATLNQNYIATLIKNGVTGRLDVWQNGGASNFVMASPNILSSPTALAIGSTLSNTMLPGNYLNGYIATVIVFTDALSDAQRTILDNYLSALYNIPLISGDFYTMDNPANGNFDFEVAGIGQGFDGSNQINSKGEGVIQINNPQNLNNSEYLFWGHDNGMLMFESNSSNVPTPYMNRLGRVWRVSEYGGDVGGVDISVDIPQATSEITSKLSLIFDANNNGTFTDDSLTGIISNAQYIGGNTFKFSNVNLPDSARFTFAVVTSFINEKNLTITPNNDGLNDEFFIPESGTAKIYDRNGKLVKELAIPGSWDGSNNQSLPASTGYYMIKINNGKSYSITIIR